MTAGLIKGSGLDLGVNGAYPGTAGARTSDGTDLLLRMAGLGEKSLLEIWNHVADHSVLAHTDWALAMADYVSFPGLTAAFGDPVYPFAIATGPDVKGNTWLSNHLVDETIHQQAAGRVIEVGKSGKPYSTLQAGHDAVPASGGDAPSASAPWIVLAWPGVYEESLVWTRPWTMLVGIDPRACVIKRSGSIGAVPAVYPPLWVRASHVRVARMGLINENAAPSDSIAFAAGNGWGQGSGSYSDIRLVGCELRGSGRDTIFVADDVTDGVRVSECYIEGYSDVISAQSDIVVRNCDCEVTGPNMPLVWSYEVKVELANLRVNRLNDANLPTLLNPMGSGNVFKLVDIEMPVSGSAVIQTIVGIHGGSTIYYRNVQCAARISGSQNGSLTWNHLRAEDDASFVPQSVAAAKGDILAATAAATIARLAVGSDGQVLTADAASTPGVKWAAPVDGTKIPLSLVDAKGDILTATANDTPARLAVGSDGQVPSADSSQATGLAYIWVPRFVGAATTDSTELVSNSAQQYFDRTITLPAGSLRAGGVLRFYAAGKLTNVTARNNYFCIFGGAAGTTGLCQNDLGFGSVGSLTNVSWQLFGCITCRTAGASGTYASAAQIAIWYQIYPLRLTGSINTTISNLLAIGWKTAATDSAHKVTLEQFEVEVM